MKKPKLVSVVWFDAQSLDDWTHVSDIVPDLAEIHTVGFLIKKTKKVLVVALNNDTTNDNYSCMINIPKAWIKEMKDL